MRAFSPTSLLRKSKHFSRFSRFETAYHVVAIKWMNTLSTDLQKIVVVPSVCSKTRATKGYNLYQDTNLYKKGEE